MNWCGMLRADIVNIGLLKKMKESGCQFIGYGFESYSPIVLKSMNKGIKPEDIKNALHLTMEAKINVLAGFIFGDIAETKETAKETLDYWKDNAQAQINLFFIQPYPGSELYKYCLKKGIIKDKLDYIQNQMSPDSRINMTEKMSDREIRELNNVLLVLFNKYAKFVRPVFMKKMSANVYMFKIKCPYCHAEAVYKNCFVPNPFMYGFHLICRNCHMRFVLVSAVQRIAYRFYSRTRSMRNRYVLIKTKLKRMFV